MHARLPIAALPILVASGALAQTTNPDALPTTSPSDAVESESILGGGSTFPQDTPERILDVTERVFPAVVRLDVAQEIYRDGKRTLQRGTGSGVIFDADGHILTNYHVAGRAQEIFVTLANKERVRGTLVGDDHWTDLAIVQLDLDEINEKNIDFIYAELAEPNSLVPGQDVIAIGTPFGLSRTMSKGIVSNIERTFYPQQSSIDGYETGWFSNWVQMDAPIAPGNSGGPLVDLNARVVGINTRGMPGSDLNFAIPIGTVTEVKDRLLAGADAKRLERMSAGDDGAAEQIEPSKVTRAEVGLDFKPLQDLESFYNIDPNFGVLVDNVDRRGPADQAGMRVQDILLSINGEPTNVRFPEELAAVRRRISEMPIGEPAEFRFLRGGEEMTVSVTPAKLESALGEESEFKAWGLSARDVTRPYANRLQLDDDTGVVVTTVRNGFPADQAELTPGDVIRQVNGQDVTDLDLFKTLYNEVEAGEGSRKVLLTVGRRQGTRTVLLSLD